MAFKLKSPLHVTSVEQTLGKGGTASGYSGKDTRYNMFSGIDYAEAEGTQNLELPTNEAIDKAVDKAEKGIPENLNPKQKARREVKDFRKGLKADAKFDRQTEKAKKIYKRNEFEAIGKDGAYVNPEKAAEIKVDDKSRAIDVAEMDAIMNDNNLSVEEKEKQVNAVRSRSPHFSDNILDKKNSPTKMLNMEKPNRAGIPVRMLRSVEDPTPMKYKSVRKAGRENLMSALAKQGEPKKKEMVNDFTMNMDDSTSLELPKPVIKQKPKKVNIKKTKSKGKGSKVTVDRKVSTKF
jgi:soluble cytochrome b562